MPEHDPFLTDHRGYHERQQARLVLLWVVCSVAFVAVLLMVFIAFRPL